MQLDLVCFRFISLSARRGQSSRHPKIRLALSKFNFSSPAATSMETLFCVGIVRRFIKFHCRSQHSKACIGMKRLSPPRYLNGFHANCYCTHEKALSITYGNGFRLCVCFIILAWQSKTFFGSQQKARKLV
jgi:hypothetical protein